MFVWLKFLDDRINEQVKLGALKIVVKQQWELSVVQVMIRDDN